MTQAHCVPGIGAVSMACRGSEHTSAVLDRVEQTDRTVELVLAMPAFTIKIRCSWSEKDYKYTIETLNKTMYFKNVQRHGRERKTV